MLDPFRRNPAPPDVLLADSLAVAAVTFALVKPGQRPLDAVGALPLGGERDA